MTQELTAEQLDRAAGVLVASAAGDALGAGYEFSIPGLGASIGMIGGGPFGFEPGEWTDDTSMAMAVAQAAAAHEDLRSESGLDSVAVGFMRWYGSGPKDIGNQTRTVLSSNPTSAAEMVAAANRVSGLTGGNGSLMRTAPVALAYLDDEDGCTAAALAVSQLTHSDLRAGQACQMWSFAIRHAILFGSFDGARTYLSTVDREQRDYWTSALDSAEVGCPSDFAKNGWVVNAVQTAWWAISTTDSSGPEHLEAALVQCVRAGNDTDTTAAIAGGLLGARWGASAVPQAWREMLHGWPGLRSDDLKSLALRAVQSVDHEPAPTLWWDGILDPNEIGAPPVRLEISDLSYRGDWPQLFSTLDDMVAYEPFANINSTRLGGKSHFTPLHQAAWSGDAHAIHGLINRGAWRSIRDADGNRPVDVYLARGHTNYTASLQPVPVHRVAERVVALLQERLNFLLDAELLRWRTSPLRYPQVEVLTEIDSGELWFGVPGKYGGYTIALDGESLHVDSSSRMGGSELYRVTCDSIDFLGHEGY